MAHDTPTIVLLLMLELATVKPKGPHDDQSCYVTSGCVMSGRLALTLNSSEDRLSRGQDTILLRS